MFRGLIKSWTFWAWLAAVIFALWGVGCADWQTMLDNQQAITAALEETSANLAAKGETEMAEHIGQAADVSKTVGEAMATVPDGTDVATGVVMAARPVASAAAGPYAPLVDLGFSFLLGLLGLAGGKKVGEVSAVASARKVIDNATLTKKSAELSSPDENELRVIDVSMINADGRTPLTL